MITTSKNLNGTHLRPRQKEIPAVMRVHFIVSNALFFDSIPFQTALLSAGPFYRFEHIEAYGSSKVVAK